MTVRHQVEMLTSNLLDKMVHNQEFTNISILSEKDTESNSPKGSIRKVDIASGYLAFLTGTPHNQNSRFIEEKLDEILVGKVMDSGVTSEKFSFSDVIHEIDRLSASMDVKNWFKNENNIIGFTLDVKKSLDTVHELNPEHFKNAIDAFEEAFRAINPSKVNVGRYRRELSQYFIENIGKLHDAPTEELTGDFFELTAN